VTPEAAQRAAFHETGQTDAGTVMDGKSLKIVKFTRKFFPHKGSLSLKKQHSALLFYY
jgi:hypothetical protein